MKFFKIAVIFLLSIQTPKNIFANCRLKNNLVSLSGPISHLLYQFNLLGQDQEYKVKAISTYNGFNEKDYSGKILPGGIFLSRGAIKEIGHSPLFFDRSEKLRTLFEKLKLESKENLGTTIEVDTFGKDPIETFEKCYQLLAPYLLGCEDLYKKEKERQKRLIEKIQENKNKDDFIILFYLGEFFKKGRYPGRLMVNDSLALFFKRRQIMGGYPSHLSYVPWSEKIIQDLRNQKKRVIHVGLTGRKKDLSDPFDKVKIESYEDKGEHFINIYGAGVLIPGVYQIKVIEEIYPLLSQLTAKNDKLK